jgi:hypothetical protein
MVCVSKISANWFSSGERFYSTAISVSGFFFGSIFGYFIPVLYLEDKKDHFIIKD